MGSNAEYFAVNQRGWDELTLIHLRGSRYWYPIDEFKRGRCVLRPLERHEVGDVAGKSLLHLQCHFGMDTLSWARLGAKVTGVDFSAESIKAARSLSKEIGVPADFVCCNVYDLREHLTGQFDIVFSTYGVLCHLPDLREWAEVIAHYLLGGGFFYIADGHPANCCIKRDESGVARLEGDYFATGHAVLEDAGPDYANPECMESIRAYSWAHTTADMINSLIDAGLRIDFFREWPGYNMELCPDGTWREAKDRPAQYPMVFSLKATKGSRGG
jgi:SAM-dependent methyltransferase